MSDWPFDDLKLFGYDVLVIDFPWNFELYSDAGEGKSARAHYDTMSIDEGKALPISLLARDHCLLLMWATAPMMPEAFDLMAAWGFAYKTEIVWRKVTASGKVRMGTGYRSRSCHEPVLIGTIGNPQHKPFRSVFDGVARRHSQKPAEFYHMVDQHCPGTFKADIFSRGGLPAGWDCWGNQSTLFDGGEAPATKRERHAPTPEMPAPMPLFGAGA